MTNTDGVFCVFPQGVQHWPLRRPPHLQPDAAVERPLLLPTDPHHSRHQDPHHVLHTEGLYSL